MKSIVNENLIQRCINGEEGALNELIQTIARYILFRTTCLLRSSMDAEDVAQEICIRVYTGVGSLKSPKAFNAWLSSVVNNETRRFMRQNYLNDDHLDMSALQDDIPEENSNYLPHERTGNEERNKSIAAVVRALPVRQREAVIYHYFDELNVNQTAKAMSIDQSSVSHYLKQARKKIKLEFERLSIQGMILLPLGAKIRHALHSEEIIFTAPKAEWSGQILENCREQALSMNYNTEITPARLSAAPKFGVAPALGITAVATVAVVVFAVFSHHKTEIPQAAPVVSELPAPQALEYDVLFSGGAADSEYVNPSQAAVWARDEYGELSALGWSIASSGSETHALHSGDGGVVQGVFDEMLEQGEEGTFTLYFSMEDPSGFRHTVYRSFTIQAEN